MWSPVSGAHSIESVAITLIFSDPIPMKMVDKSSKYLTTDPTRFGFSEAAKIATASLSFQLPQAGMSAQGLASQETEEMGFEFSSIVDPELEKLRITKNEILFHSRKYGSWSAFFERFRVLTDDFLLSALDASNVSIARLEYNDRFIFDGDPNEANANEVVELPAAHISEDVLTSIFPWHSNTGWLEKADNGLVLTNLNLAKDNVTNTKLPGQTFASILISTILEARLNKHIENTEGLHSLLETLHNLSKATTKSILTNQAAHSVGLL